MICRQYLFTSARVSKWNGLCTIYRKGCTMTEKPLCQHKMRLVCETGIGRREAMMQEKEWNWNREDNVTVREKEDIELKKIGEFILLASEYQARNMLKIPDDGIFPESDDACGLKSYCCYTKTCRIQGARVCMCVWVCNVQCTTRINIYLMEFFAFITMKRMPW